VMYKRICWQINGKGTGIAGMQYRSAHDEAPFA
jgi:hypothetical protein